MSNILDVISAKFLTRKAAAFSFMLMFTIGIIAYPFLYYNGMLHLTMNQSQNTLYLFIGLWLVSSFLFVLCFPNIRLFVSNYLTGLFHLHLKVLLLIVAVSISIWGGFFLDPSFFRELRAKHLIELNAERDRISDALLQYADKPQWEAVKAEYVRQLSVIKGEIDLLTKDQNKEDAKDPKQNAVVQYEVFLYFIVRSLCLGALGSLVVLVTKQTLHLEHPVDESLFSKKNYWQLFITHTLLGGTVSVIVLGLFYTRQISIFDEAIDKAPEYWRVTIFCLLSGAFSDKIVRAAYSQIEDILNRSVGSNSKSSGGSQGPGQVP